MHREVLAARSRARCERDGSLAFVYRALVAGLPDAWQQLQMACGAGRDEPSLVTPDVIAILSDFDLRLVGSPSVKINARLKPTLELK